MSWSILFTFYPKYSVIFYFYTCLSHWKYEYTCLNTVGMIFCMYTRMYLKLLLEEVDETSLLFSIFPHIAVSHIAVKCAEAKFIFFFQKEANSFTTQNWKENKTKRGQSSDSCSIRKCYRERISRKIEERSGKLIFRLFWRSKCYTFINMIIFVCFQYGDMYNIPTKAFDNALSAEQQVCKGFWILFSWFISQKASLKRGIHVVISYL